MDERYAAAQEAGLDDADFTSVAELYERAAGLRLQRTGSEVVA